MIRTVCCSVFFFFFVVLVNAQPPENLQSIALDSVLKKNAHAIVRYNDVVITVNNPKSVVVSIQKIVSVLDEKGRHFAVPHTYYDGNSKIKKQEVIVYNSSGTELKKYKKGDFYDQSTSDGFSLISDNRVKYLNYTPTSYPYTVSYTSVIEYGSTAFVKPWRPIESYGLSIEFSSYQLRNPSKIPIRFKAFNLDKYDIATVTTIHELHFTLKSQQALSKEQMGPRFSSLTPKVLVALSEFSLEGISGTGDDWSSFGKWQYENLIQDRGEISEATIKQVNGLVEGLSTKEEKVRAIYEYVQSKTRYVSVQLGIGGWMPMEAKVVDELGYGDCKALSNYTKSLLESQDIPAFYTVVYGGVDKKDLDTDFASMQGNHVILNVPNGNQDYWLECTSQDNPFNFIAGFTDDRNVLVVKPEGGVIKKTPKYTETQNEVATQATFRLNPTGDLTGALSMKSKGMYYASRYRIPKKDSRDRTIYYKNKWDYLNDIIITDIKFNNDKKAPIFEENMAIKVRNYASNVGQRLLISPNVLNRFSKNMPYYSNRKTPLVINRGYAVLDQYEIEIPETYKMSNLFEPKSLDSTFGRYQFRVTKKDEQTLMVVRELVVFEGHYKIADYELYRQFTDAITKFDNAKIILTRQ